MKTSKYHKKKKHRSSIRNY